MNTKICTACLEEKPLDLFMSGRTLCKRCHCESWKCYRNDRDDRERHQRQVQLNKLINSIPRVM